MLLSFGDAFRGLRRGSPVPARTFGPIGVDIAANAIHLCQLRAYDDTRFEIVAHTSLPFEGARLDLIADSKRLIKTLRDGLRRHGFHGKRAVAAMPPDQVKFTPITYKAERAHAGAAVLRAVSSRIDGPLSDYTVDYLPVRSGLEQEESLALAAVARRDEVTSFLTSLETAGLRMQALDIGPAAIRRLMSVFYSGSDGGETMLVLNAGAERSYLSVISGRRLLFDQPVEFGEQILIDDLSRALDIPPAASRELVVEHGLEPSAKADAVIDPEHPDIAGTLREIVKHRFIELVDEINRILVFTAAETRGQPIGRICVLGSIARWPGAEGLLRQLIDIPDSPENKHIDEYFVRRGKSLDESAFSVPDMAVATGLALRGVLVNE